MLMVELVDGGPEEGELGGDPLVKVRVVGLGLGLGGGFGCWLAGLMVAGLIMEVRPLSPGDVPEVVVAVVERLVEGDAANRGHETYSSASESS